MSQGAPVGVRIRDAVLVFNVLLSEGHEEPKWCWEKLAHFAAKLRECASNDSDNGLLRPRSSWQHSKAEYLPCQG